MRQAVRSTKRLELFDLRVGSASPAGPAAGRRATPRAWSGSARSRHVECASPARPPASRGGYARRQAVCAISKPCPGSPSGPSAGTRTFSYRTSAWSMASSGSTHVPGSAGRDDARRVARHEEHRHAVVRIGVEVGHAAPTMRRPRARVRVKNFSPLMTQSCVAHNTGRRADPAAPPCGSVIENAENNSPSSSGCGYRARAAPACRSARSPPALPCRVPGPRRSSAPTGTGDDLVHQT